MNMGMFSAIFGRRKRLLTDTALSEYTAADTRDFITFLGENEETMKEVFAGCSLQERMDDLEIKFVQYHLAHPVVCNAFRNYQERVYSVRFTEFAQSSEQPRHFIPYLPSQSLLSLSIIYSNNLEEKLLNHVNDMNALFSYVDTEQDNILLAEYFGFFRQLEQYCTREIFDQYHNKDLQRKLAALLLERVPYEMKKPSWKAIDEEIYPNDLDLLPQYLEENDKS